MSILFCMLCSTSFSQQTCTKLGTFVGTYSPAFIYYLDAEQPQVARTMLSDASIELIANSQPSMDNFIAFLDTLEARGIDAVVSIRFKYSDSLFKEDRIITDSTELANTLSNIETVLVAADGKLDYVQVLNETFGVGKYNQTIDSLALLIGQTAAEQEVLDWIDTIAYSFRNIIDSNNLSVELLSPSVQMKGLDAVKNNLSGVWTYKLTMKNFEVANAYCDHLNFHWYPEALVEMQDLIVFSDTTSLIDPGLGRTCTEWSQGHEIRAVLETDTAFWNNALLLHCETTDTALTSDYLALINDSLGIDHSDTYEMYQLMNQSGFIFASYFAMLQDYFNCQNDLNVWYALAAIYATKFTAEKVPNGEFYVQYQNIKQYIDNQCTVGITEYPEEEESDVWVKYNSLSNRLEFVHLVDPLSISEVVVYDLSGRQLVNKRSGTITFLNLPDNCSSGVVIVRLKTDGGYIVKKVPIVR
ncbi:MAG: T9SS type A sorting domain-containing protein [Crocinitomicaceae bacterium]|nr:T9SS type A sorting domain-containing protein [Crocinitomicaceae bacterium]